MIQNSIAKGLSFLAEEQLSYGEFKTYLSTDESMLNNLRFDSSPFCTSLIIYCISFLDEKIAKDITQKAVQFLIDEKEDPSLWRYWSSKNRKHKLIPPDLDDTACISYVLKKYYSPLLYSYLFPSNIDVILNQKNKDGLFNTFIPSNHKYNSSIDSVVNANVLLYLGESDVTKDVSKYLCDIILTDNEASSDSWYPDTVTLYYFISRAYFNGAKSLGVLREVLAKKITLLLDNGTFIRSSMHSALAICSLLNVNYNEEKVLDDLIQNLLDCQRDNGAWPIYSLWGGNSGEWSNDSRNYPEGFWGSEELTTAFCIEALVRSTKERQFS